MGDPESISICHIDIGIPINFQDESCIISFRNIELPMHLKLKKVCEASCRDEAGN